MRGSSTKTATRHLLASTVPACCQAYDPAFAYELAAIVRDGIRRMYGVGEDIFYYLTIYNENYVQPPEPDDLNVEHLLAGMYQFASAPPGRTHWGTIMFSGAAQGAAREAAELLASEHDVAVDLWSATSYKALREEALSCERWNTLHPDEAPRVPFVTRQLADGWGPVIAVTDFMRAVPDQVSRWIGRDYTSLGTDGFGRSDTRSRLREHFEVTAEHITVAVLWRLAELGEIDSKVAAEAIKRYGLATDSADPWSSATH